uniref:Uncharacterized protein n=1 Tax=Anopheles dirus TaxID=7168 RepID=A0A182NT09_9DIPT
MRKKFVQTLAAQQLELSSHIRTHDMELDKEQPRQYLPQQHQQQPQQQNQLYRHQPSGTVDDPIEIMDDDQEVELMMERHRKYHPRKYVNLQQPPSKIYYDAIDKSLSPTLDKENQDMDDDEDERNQLVIDCMKEPNNNSNTVHNSNCEQPNGGLQSGGFTSIPMTNETHSTVRHPPEQLTAATNYIWHTPQTESQIVSNHMELLRMMQHRMNSSNLPSDTPAPMMMQQYPPSQQNPQRTHPYERSSSSMGMVPPNSSGKSAFSTPQDKPQEANRMTAEMMPPPPPQQQIPPAMPVAPRTPFYQPYVAPYSYADYSGNGLNFGSFSALDEWLRAGYPPPHMLSATEYQYYYNCYISRLILQQQQQEQQQQEQQQQQQQQSQHDHHYRDYSTLALAAGIATAGYLPPPQYGFAKPAAPASVEPPVYGTPSAVNFSQHNGGDSVGSSGAAGYLPASLPETSAASPSQAVQPSSYPTSNQQPPPNPTTPTTDGRHRLVAPRPEVTRPSVINETPSPAHHSSRSNVLAICYATAAFLYATSRFYDVDLFYTTSCFNDVFFFNVSTFCFCDIFIIYATSAFFHATSFVHVVSCIYNISVFYDVSFSYGIHVLYCVSFIYATSFFHDVSFICAFYAIAFFYAISFICAASFLYANFFIYATSSFFCSTTFVHDVPPIYGIFVFNVSIIYAVSFFYAVFFCYVTIAFFYATASGSPIYAISVFYDVSFINATYCFYAISACVYACFIFYDVTTVCAIFGYITFAFFYATPFNSTISACFYACFIFYDVTTVCAIFGYITFAFFYATTFDSSIIPIDRIYVFYDVFFINATYCF